MRITDPCLLNTLPGTFIITVQMEKRNQNSINQDNTVKFTASNASLSKEGKFRKCECVTDMLQDAFFCALSSMSNGFK